MNVPAWPMPIHQTKLMIAERPGDRDVVAPQRRCRSQTVQRDADASSSSVPRAGDREREPPAARARGATIGDEQLVAELGVGRVGRSSSGRRVVIGARELRVGVVDLARGTCVRGRVPSSCSTA